MLGRLPCLICAGQLYSSGCVGCSHVKTMIPLSYPTCKYLIKGIEFQVLPECGHNDLYLSKYRQNLFQAVITVNLTSMLVLTTIFIDVSNNLPKTSYMKMIDIWLLVNLMLPFTVVLTHTYMDTLRDDEEQTTAETKASEKKNKKLATVKRFSLFYNPALIITFALVYWVVGLRHANII